MSVVTTADFAGLLTGGTQRLNGTDRNRSVKGVDRLQVRMTLQKILHGVERLGGRGGSELLSDNFEAGNFAR